MSRTAIHAVKPINGQRFEEMLNILPPLNWRGLGTSAESFRMSEMLNIGKVTLFVRIGSPRVAAAYFELVAGDQVTHLMAVAHCTDLVLDELLS